MIVKDFIKYLENNYNPNDNIAYDIWCKEDVEAVAKDLEIELTEDELDNIINKINKHKSAEEGINWYVIESHIKYINTEKNK